MNNKKWLVVGVGALGYFVDIYDLVLFSIVRVASLKSLGVPEADLLGVGVHLLNAQMAGMLVGGLLWGILGDKKGRVSVLFGSIFLYSICNLANAYVNSVEVYALLRFLAGVGLAGELGAAITLVSESLSIEHRGYGTALVAGIGLSGAVVAGLTAGIVGWRTSYMIGGSLGILLLLLRIGMFESHLFESVKKESSVPRGQVAMLFAPKRLLRYLSCILIGLPIWFVVGILMTFCPELGKELQTTVPLQAGKAILFSYAGIALGDVATGFISQWIKSRKKTALGAMILEGVLIVILLSLRGITDSTFYFFAFWIGFASGYWAVFMTLTSEQFGTNLRATVTTSVPNFVRGAVVPMTLSFSALGQHVSLISSAAIVGLTVFTLGSLGLFKLEETYSKDLNFLETV